MKKWIITAGVILVLFLIAGWYVDQKAAELKQTYGSKFFDQVTSQIQNSLTGLSPVHVQGKAPELTGITHWLNSDPLTIAGLKGKVVLIDFWTYSCIDCVRTLPSVTKWDTTYRDQGLVIIGVHTPEFPFENETKNVADAIAHFNIHYAVAQDNNYGTWNVYQNEYWPAEYLIDQNGNIAYTHFGDQDLGETENAIRTLLGLGPVTPNAPGYNVAGIQSPEMYFGTFRLHNLVSGQRSSTQPFVYQLPQDVPLNSFALGGTWQFAEPYASLVTGPGTIRLKFHAAKLYMVASSAIAAPLSLVVDGVPQPSVTVQAPQLYTLYDSSSYAEHVIDIQMNTPGFQAYTFTFG
jgi:thiol-disulfide isomerase/thioredoxin